MIARTTLNALLAGCALLAMSHVAGAQNVTEVQTVKVTPYLNGGIGKDEADAMRRVAPDFALRLTFAEGANQEFTANVPVVITDAKRNPVSVLADAGPLLYVGLPPGRYTVSAQDNGVTRAQRVTLAGKGGRDVIFCF